MQWHNCFSRRFDNARRPRTDAAFRLAESDEDLCWLCVGEYRGHWTVKAWLRYAAARFKDKQYEAAYRIFVTDCLRYTTENTARFAGDGGRYITARFADIIGETAVEETRTEGEIIETIKTKLNDLAGDKDGDPV